VRVARIIGGILSVLLLLGSGYGWMADRTLQSKITRVAGLAPGGGDADGKAQNVLLIGDDHRPPGASAQVLAELNTQQDGGSVNTDTMMVLHIPADGSKPTVISLPRDSWVDIPGNGKGKLNSAFAIGVNDGGGDAGGIKLLIQTIQQLTGLRIDHFVRVSLLGFYQVAQALGPIQVCLNQPARDPFSGIDLPAGVSQLNASQALAFVRQRHGLPRGDLDREVRQQYFLSAALRTAISQGVLTNPGRMSKLLNAVGSALQTDPDLDLLRLGTLFPHLSASDVRFTTIPITGTPTITDDNGNEISIVAVDTVALPAFIASVIGQPSAYTDASPASPKDVQLTVVNGTGTPGLARTDAATLGDLGFSPTVQSGSVSTSLTTIVYPAGREAAAKAVAAVVPGALVAHSDSVGQVTLTLGADGKRVTAPATAGSGATSGAASPAPAASPGPSAPAAAGDTQSFSGGSCVN
jgi:LCP family protein required for cell wall assembly